MKRPLALQLAADLLSLVVALVLGWPAGVILLLYWAENVVVALWQVPRILLAGWNRQAPRDDPGTHAEKTHPAWKLLGWVVSGSPGFPPLSNLFTAAFFLVHYGMFTFVHGVFVFQFFLHQEMTPHALVENLGRGGMALALLGLVISHGAAFVEDLSSDRLQHTEAGKVMSEPYRRIVVLHLVVLGSGFLIELTPASSTPTVGVVLLALVKTAMDIHLWRKGSFAREAPDVARIP